MGARELGSPLGNPLGLKRGGSGDYERLLNDPTIVDFVGAATAVSGIYTIPPQFKFFRVTVVGAGSGGNTAGGIGAGGGCSQTKILPTNGRSIDINYVAARTSPAQTIAVGNSSADFLNYSMSAGGAGLGTTYGTATGGDFNFRGGAGRAGGGGAGGPRGNGGDGASALDSLGANGSGGGGGGGACGNSAYAAGGGGGVFAPGAGVTPGRPETTLSNSGSTWGSPGGPVGGGQWGGGGGYNGTGGAGGVRIELW